MHHNAMTCSSNSSLAIFAHELREPLASILLAVQSVSEIGNTDAVSREMWGIVDRQSHYLANMINQVMEIGQGAHHEKKLSREWIDCGTVVTNAAEAVRSLLTQRGHQLAVFLPSTRVYMTADQLRLQQVIVNLVANAAKYTEPGGKIAVNLKIVNGLVIFEVRDNGIGISAELLPRVFDLFRQGSQRRETASSGLGIGLALVKSLVELHGGTVSARSDGAGTGSTFTVILPQNASEARPQQRSAPDSSRVSVAQSIRAASAMLDA